MIRRLLPLLLCWPSLVWATPQMIIGRSNVALDATGTEVTCPMGREGISATSTFCVVPAAGTFGRLAINLITAPDNGAGTQSFSFTIQTAASGGSPTDTALTCTISETATSCQDTSNTISVSASDLIQIEVTPTNTPAVGQGLWSMEFIPTTAGQTIFMSGTDSVWSTTADNFMSFARAAATATEDDRYGIMGLGGTAAALYVEFNTDPTNVGSSYAVTVRDCGPYTTISCADSALSCTVSAGSKTCSDTSGFTIDAEDIVTIETDPSATAPVDPNKVSFGVRVDTTNTQTFQLVGSTNANLDTANTTYLNWIGLDETTSTTEASHTTYPHELMVTGLWVWLSADPGTAGSDAYRFTVRDDGADTACTLLIEADNTTNEITTCTDVIKNLSAVNLEVTPVNTPSVATMDTAWGIALAYVPRRKILVE